MPPAVSHAARRVFRMGILSSFAIPERSWTDSTRPFTLLKRAQSMRRCLYRACKHAILDRQHTPFILLKRADSLRRCLYRACKHVWCAHARWRLQMHAWLACDLCSAEQRGHGRQMRAVAERRFARACARGLWRDNIRAQSSHLHPGPRWARTGRRRLPEPRQQQPVSYAQQRPPRRWTLKLAPSATQLPRCGGPGAARASKSSAARARTP